jgi:diadenylate cyclase
MEEKEKLMLEYLKKVSPGTSLRTVINDLIRSELGALIVIEAPDIEKYIEGGFRINCRFTPQRLFELSKMDGAIIISQDLRRILYANVLLTPDATITTNETGTRHKAAERTAKQLNTFVIAVSERKKKTTLYYGNIRYTLRTAEEVSREITNTLTILEKQRELLDELMSKINILEISGLASVTDVCKILQKTEIILRNSEMLKKDFIEIGKEGSLMNLRYKELIKGVEKRQDDIIRDYSKISVKKTKTLLNNMSYEGILELESIARLVFEKELEENVSPKGFRFLSELNLSDKEISTIVSVLDNLTEIINDETNKLEQVLNVKTINIKEEIAKLKEKIIEGRVIV